jgi:hypothetical protein
MNFILKAPGTNLTHGTEYPERLLWFYSVLKTDQDQVIKNSPVEFVNLFNNASQLH